MADLAELLRRTPVLRKLSDQDRDSLSRFAARRTFKKGESIARLGEVWSNLILVESGLIHVTKASADARSLLLLELQAGDVFWGHSFFDDQPLPASLEVGEQSIVYLWPRSAVAPLIRQNNEALWEMCQVIVRRTYRASEFIEGLAFQPLSGRLARLLLEQWGGAAEKPVPRDLTLDEMAAKIGTKREVVCRLLYRFADEGLIHITRTQLVFTDRDGLERLAGA